MPISPSLLGRAGEGLLSSLTSLLISRYLSDFLRKLSIVSASGELLGTDTYGAYRYKSCVVSSVVSLLEHLHDVCCTECTGEHYEHGFVLAVGNHHYDGVVFALLVINVYFLVVF